MTYTVRQIAAILGVTERAVQKRAKNEGWQAVSVTGPGQTQEFKLAALPRDIKDEISKAKGPRQAPGDFVTIMEIATAMGVTRQAANKRALDEGWPFDPLVTKPKRYVVESLPEDVRAVITNPDSLGSGYVALKRIARNGRYVEKRKRTTLGDEEFRLLLGKIKQILGVRSDAGVARALGCSQSTMIAAKKRKQIPSGWLIQIAREKGVSLDWLIFGAASPGTPLAASAGPQQEHEGRPPMLGDQSVRQRLQELRRAMSVIVKEIELIEGMFPPDERAEDKQ